MEKLLRRKLSHGRFVQVSRQRSRQMSAVKGRGNRTTEKRLRSALARARIAGWILAPAGIVGRPDFFFTKSRLAVFVDGCFWHGCPRCGHVPKANHAFWLAKIERNRLRDRKTNAVLRATGIEVIRIWEHQLARSLAGCVEQIASSVRSSNKGKVEA